MLNSDYNQIFAIKGDIFKKLPFFTCWSRKNEEEMLLHQKVTKLGPSAGVPDSFNSTLEFNGYNKPLKCSGGIENPKYHDIWISSNSRQWKAPVCKIEGSTLFAHIYNNDNCYFTTDSTLEVCGL